MNILDWYIARTVAVSTFLVLLVLLSLFVFVDFVTELGEVSRGRYSIVEASQFVLLSLPRRIAELMPVTCLLGTTLGLGILANSSELTAMRAAGVSIMRISGSVMLFGLVLLVIIFFCNEYVAPKTEQWAQDLRANAVAKNNTLLSREGFWTRDGMRFVRVQTVLFRDLLSGLEIFEVMDRQLRKVTQAEFATYSADGLWVLHNVKSSIISTQAVRTETAKTQVWHTDLKPDLLDVVSIRPERLALWDLNYYVNYLKDNGQDAQRYELAFWKKVALPIVMFVMIMVSIPFIFGPLRSVAIGQRIIVGTLVGIGFHVFDQTAAHLGLVYRIEPWVSAFIPALVFLSFAFWMMRWVR